jgi:hypothetical protein
METFDDPFERPWEKGYVRVEYKDMLIVKLLGEPFLPESGRKGFLDQLSGYIGKNPYYQATPQTDTLLQSREYDLQGIPYCLRRWDYLLGMRRAAPPIQRHIRCRTGCLSFFGHCLGPENIQIRRVGLCKPGLAVWRTSTLAPLPSQGW